ncbi:MAG TPA: DNA repair protein RecO [Alphaproteobacteria bacterium]|nr:DNA repair protein RecO [Alphaproteobacteria bacterium]
MEWRDDGIVLSTRRHGETGTVVVLMTRDHGRHAGLTRGQRLRAQLQPGTKVAAVWRARLSDHLGSYALEPTESVAALMIDDPLKLAALSAACALVEAALPERAPYPNVHDGLAALLEALKGPFWDAAYVQWEIGLLRAMGFGMDLERCAATGTNDQLAYVSPRSGRAVSLSAGEPYRDRLLPLPAFLIGRGEADPPSVLAGLDLTGHFLARNLFAQAHLHVPAARERFVDRYRKTTAISGTNEP